MLVFLSLVGAWAYGTSDFLGGLASRKNSAWLVGIVTSFVPSLILFTYTVISGESLTEVSGNQISWAILSGLGGAFGIIWLYRGLSKGAMGVAAPLSAIGSALIPLLYAVASGHQPGVLAWVGIALAIPAVWLIAAEPGASATLAAGLVPGLLAGVGFGLQFIALAKLTAETKLTGLALSLFFSTLTIFVTSKIVKADLNLDRSGLAQASLAGIFAGLGLFAFTQAAGLGNLAIAAVLTSLFPAFTVLLASWILKEKLRKPQWLGLGLALAAVSLISQK